MPRAPRFHFGLMPPLAAALLACGSPSAAPEVPDFGDAGLWTSSSSTASSSSPAPGLDLPAAGRSTSGAAVAVGGATSSACASALVGTLRDFVNKAGFSPASALDDDFQNVVADDRGIVETDLGPDGKPVYAHPGGTTPTTHGQTQFDWWYRDTPGKNLPFDFTVPLKHVGGGLVAFDAPEFFPLDGRGWDDEYRGDDGRMHNFSFTLELHGSFVYAAGDVFSFAGDDDVFVFIAGKLVVDLGGVHPTETKSITLDRLVTDDAVAAPVRLVVGGTYPIAIFFNERHTSGSHFLMQTSLAFVCTPVVLAP